MLDPVTLLGANAWTTVKYLVSHIANLEEAIRYFSNNNREQRERWVCRRLVEALGVSSLHELHSSPNDPPDCLFGSARFEVKERQDCDRKRHQEFKEALKKATEELNALDSGQLVSYPDDRQDETEGMVGNRKSSPTAPVVGARVEDMVEEAIGVANAAILHYEPATVAGLDLVVYVNREVWLDREHSTRLSSTYTFPWRSVSMVENEVVIVLHAAADAPAFLVNAVGRIYPYPSAEDSHSN